MVQCGAICAVFLLKNHKLHCTMRCDAVRCTITCGAAQLYYFAGNFDAIYAV